MHIKQVFFLNLYHVAPRSLFHFEEVFPQVLRTLEVLEDAAEKNAWICGHLPTTITAVASAIFTSTTAAAARLLRQPCRESE